MSNIFEKMGQWLKWAFIDEKTPNPYAKPTPTVMPTATPTPRAKWMIDAQGNQVPNPPERPPRPIKTSPYEPSPTPTSSDGYAPQLTPTPTQQYFPTATPSPIPSHIKEIANEERPYNKEIADVWGDKTDSAHLILRYLDEQDVVRGENVSYMAGKEIDVPNRINIKTGQYDKDAPIKTYKNPLTGKTENSIDRGLFRINNSRFYGLLGGKVERQQMYERGIIPKPHLDREGLKQKAEEYWERMLDPTINAKMAKFMYEEIGPSWFAASPESGGRL